MMEETEARFLTCPARSSVSEFGPDSGYMPFHIQPIMLENTPMPPPQSPEPKDPMWWEPPQESALRGASLLPIQEAGRAGKPERTWFVFAVRRSPKWNL